MVRVHHVQDLRRDHVLDWFPHGIYIHGRREDIDAIEATFAVLVAVDLGDELHQEVAFTKQSRAHVQSQC